MKPNRTLTLSLTLAVMIASNAWAALPAAMPKFMDANELADWRAEVAEQVSAKDKAQAKADAAAADQSFYTGKPYLPATGSYAFKYRSYQPELARWTSEDPSGFPDGANANIYAPTPTSEFDWMGLSARDIGIRDIPFVLHYYFGKGNNLDASNLLTIDEILNYGGNTIMTQAVVEAHESAVARNRGDFKGDGNDVFRPDMEKVIFSIGNTTINANWNWIGSIDSVGKYSFSGDISFSLIDSFKDVRDFDDTQNGNQELGGNPYSISGFWKKTFTGEGTVE